MSNEDDVKQILLDLTAPWTIEEESSGRQTWSRSGTNLRILTWFSSLPESLEAAELDEVIGEAVVVDDKWNTMVGERLTWSQARAFADRRSAPKPL